MKEVSLSPHPPSLSAYALRRAMWGHSEKVDSYMPTGLTKIQPWQWHLDLGFLAVRTNDEKINFYCSNHLVYDTLLWQPKQMTTLPVSDNILEKCRNKEFTGSKVTDTS